MSIDILELAMKMNMRNLEIQLALQCAPVISGIKAANLLIIDRQDVPGLMEILTDSHLSYVVLLKAERKVTILLYNPIWLEAYLSIKKIKHFFSSYGYEVLELKEILMHFQVRYQAYKREGQSFPHEMGLLLGYPLEDVEGFIRNQGKNCLYTGYWKVYKNVPTKVRLFSRYEVAKETLLQLIQEGVSITDIMHQRNRLQVVAI